MRPQATDLKPRIVVFGVGGAGGNAVNNVFDSDPPLSTSTGTVGNGNTYPQLYDSNGRYFFFGVTANF